MRRLFTDARGNAKLMINFFWPYDGTMMNCFRTIMIQNHDNACILTAIISSVRVFRE